MLEKREPLPREQICSMTAGGVIFSTSDSIAAVMALAEKAIKGTKGVEQK